MVGVRSVFQKDGDLDTMADSDSCASASARESLQLHSNHETQHRRHTGTNTDLDADDSVEKSATMDGPPLASLSLTHVHYDPTSKISHACAFLALVPQALCITYATLIWSTREMEILLMFAGQMGCEALNWVLKRFIREDRPAQMLGKGYGMPSSHAQFVAFFAVYLGLWVVVRHDPWKHTESKTHVPTPMWQRVGLALLAMGGAVAVAQSRIHLNYHTPRQVYAGFAVGSLCGIAWFIATSVGRHYGLVDYLLDLGPIRWLRMRDLVVNEDLVDAGWERWETKRLRLRELAGHGTAMKNR